MSGTKFDQLEIPAPILRAIAARGYESPTPVQEAVLAAELRGRDLLVSSRTGSGKTLAFGLVLARELLGTSEKFAAAPTPLALIVAPTRELAHQISVELEFTAGLEKAEAELRRPHLMMGLPRINVRPQT